MTDPVTFIINLITRLMVNIGWFLGGALNEVFIGALRYPNRTRRPPRAKRELVQSKESETRRIAGCRQVVLDYANALGFIAREAMSREELEQKIDSGISCPSGKPA